MYYKRFELGTADRIHLNYHRRAGRQRKNGMGVKVASDAFVADGPPFELVFHSAVMRVHVSEEKPESVFSTAQTGSHSIAPNSEFLSETRDGLAY